MKRIGESERDASGFSLGWGGKQTERWGTFQSIAVSGLLNPALLLILFWHLSHSALLYGLGHTCQLSPMSLLTHWQDG